MSAKRKNQDTFFFSWDFFFFFLNKKCFFFQVKLRRISALIGTSNCHVILQLFFQSPRTPTQTATPLPSPPPRLTQSTPPNQRTANPVPPTHHPPYPGRRKYEEDEGPCQGARERQRGKGMCRRYLFIVQILVPGVEGLSLLLSNKNPTYSIFNQMRWSVILSYFPLHSRHHTRDTKKQEIELCRKRRHSCFYRVYEIFTVYYNKSQWCYCCKTVCIF